MRNSIKIAFGNHRFFSSIQNRWFSQSVEQTIRYKIDAMYCNLLNQSKNSAIIPCNFIRQVFDEWAQYQDKTAITCIDCETNEETEISYSTLMKRSHQIANFFMRQNLKKGDSVALMLGQRPVWWYSLAGLIRAGIGVVPCPRLLTSNDLSYRINDLKISGIITSPEIEERINIIRAQTPSLKMAITTGESKVNWTSISNIFDQESTETTTIPETTTDDPCIYLYTSGTTGQPKAVVHHHDYPFFHWPTGKRWLKATSNDLIYNASDTGWGFTVWITLAAWSTGATLLITPTNKKFDPQKMLRLLQEKKITLFCAAPTVLRLLVAQNNFDQFKFPTLKRIVTVGEALDETVIERFSALGIEVAVGFGQAETPLLMGRVDDEPHVPKTMGKPLDPYKVVILDDTFSALEPENTGQIALDLVQGTRAGVMRGYANDPEKTQKAYSPDGRFYLTGDWATYRRDGLFSYQGRKDDLIKSRGYRVGPDEVEKAGMLHPTVAKIAVVGVQTELQSSAITIKAFVLLKPGYIANPKLLQEIQEHIKNETSPHKYPRLIECLSQEEWEKYETTSGKIRRAGLRDREKLKLLASTEQGVTTSYRMK